MLLLRDSVKETPVAQILLTMLMVMAGNFRLFERRAIVRLVHAGH